MSKKGIITLVSVIGCLLIIILIFNLTVGEIDSKDGITEDSLRFKQVYERLNGIAYENNPSLVFQTIEIPSDNPFVFASFDEIIYLLENNGTGVVYLGFPNCSWCRNLVPVLIEAASDFGLEKILHRNIYEDRNLLEIQDDEIIELREGNPGYLRILELLGERAPIYRELFPLNDGTIRRIYVPVVLFIRDGEIIRYQGNLDSFQARVNQNDDITSFDPMNEDEIDELKHIFLEYFARLFNY